MLRNDTVGLFTCCFHMSAYCSLQSHAQLGCPHALSPLGFGPPQKQKFRTNGD